MSYVDQELSIEDMLADPIVQTLMRYDGISASDVRHTIEQVTQTRAGKSAFGEFGSTHHTRISWASESAQGNRLRHKAA